MKTKLAILLIAMASVAHANLIDLTPGGFLSQGVPPPVVLDFLQRVNNTTFAIADATINGGNVTWISGFPLGADNMTVIPNGTDALLSWSLTDTGGYSLHFLWVLGSARINLYRVSPDSI